MNTCDTCKHWGIDSHTGGDATIDPFFLNLGYKECGQSGSEGDDGMDIDGCEMGNSPVLVTGPKFGCIHHEPT